MLPENLRSRYNLRFVERIGKGARMTFYVGLSEYHNRLNLLIVSYREDSKYVGGLYALPASLIQEFINALSRLRDKIKSEGIELEEV